MSNTEQEKWVNVISAQSDEIRELQRQLQVARDALIELRDYGQRDDEMAKADGILEESATGYVHGKAAAALKELNPR